MYITLDLETTGLDAENDSIIEVGAAIFDETGIIKKFSKLVDPGFEIPEMVTHITGIKSEDVKGAPRFEEIAKELEEFIGDYPIVGHNIAFDTGFLKAKGLKLKNPEFDTFILSTVLLPLQESYSLETLTDTLNIKHKDKHRAYDDAIASMELFSILVEKIKSIKPETLIKIKQALQTGGHDLHLLFNRFSGTNTKAQDFQEEVKASREETKSQQIDIKVEDFFKIYSRLDLISQIIPDYQKRESQEAITQSMLQAFETPHHYILEAGTGTGKTMAYLLAAAYHSLTTGEQVVIATNTKTLQEQIIQKDLPQSRKILELFFESQLKTPLKLQAQTLKGRNNYISLKRFQIFRDRNKLTAKEALFTTKVLVWLETTQTGDREELNLQGEEYFFFQEICCQDKACLHDDQQYKKGCYLLKNRESAKSADILIVNHSLLCQDMKLGFSLLPNYQYLVIDEAHHLEDSVTSTYTNYFTSEYSTKIIEEFQSSLNSLNKNLQGSLFLSDTEVEQINQATEQANTLPDKIQILFGLIGIFYKNNLLEGQQTIILNQYFSQTTDWNKVLMSTKSVIEILSSVLSTISDLILNEDKPEFSKENFSIQQLITTFNITKEWLEKLQSTFQAQSENEDEKSNVVIWVDQNYFSEIRVQSSPIDIGQILEEKLYSQKNSTVMLSATLTVNHSFDFFRDRLKLGENFEEMLIPSHFNYPEQVNIILPENIPAPNHPAYTSTCANIIREAILAFNGRTLVLFTSQRAIEETYKILAPQFKDEGFEIYAQNITGSKGKILQKFRGKGEKKAIFGTNTFWEGVDIKGDDIKCVIIQKLPFDPPYDPIHMARGAGYMNGFAEYALPRAIIKFKQGFGRLIRSEEDTGSIIVLDNRLTAKEYGKLFLESLPEGIEVRNKINNTSS